MTRKLKTFIKAYFQHSALDGIIPSAQGMTWNGKKDLVEMTRDKTQHEKDIIALSFMGKYGEIKS